MGVAAAVVIVVVDALNGCRSKARVTLVGSNVLLPALEETLAAFDKPRNRRRTACGTCSFGSMHTAENSNAVRESSIYARRLLRSLARERESERHRIAGRLLERPALLSLRMRLTLLVKAREARSCWRLVRLLARERERRCNFFSVCSPGGVAFFVLLAGTVFHEDRQREVECESISTCSRNVFGSSNNNAGDFSRLGRKIGGRFGVLAWGFGWFPYLVWRVRETSRS